MNMTLCRALPLALVFVLGCNNTPSRNVNLSAWQKNVENYVHIQGKGDPTVLRDVTIPDGRKGYAMIGNPIVKDSTDAVGLLLGVPRMESKPALVYLVGLVHAGKTTDIRLAILTFDQNRPHWSIGPSDAHALQTYMKYRVDRWKNASPVHPDVPLEIQNFPAPDDVFTLNVNNGQATAAHQATGAAWSARPGTSAR